MEEIYVVTGNYSICALASLKGKMDSTSCESGLIFIKSKHADRLA